MGNPCEGGSGRLNEFRLIVGVTFLKSGEARS
jgi:hypothetical protein